MQFFGDGISNHFRFDAMHKLLIERTALSKTGDHSATLLKNNGNIYIYLFYFKSHLFYIFSIQNHETEPNRNHNREALHRWSHRWRPYTHRQNNTQHQVITTEALPWNGHQKTLVEGLLRKIVFFTCYLFYLIFIYWNGSKRQSRMNRPPSK